MVEESVESVILTFMFMFRSQKVSQPAKQYVGFTNDAHRNMHSEHKFYGALQALQCNIIYRHDIRHQCCRDSLLMLAIQFISANLIMD